MKSIFCFSSSRSLGLILILCSLVKLAILQEPPPPAKTVNAKTHMPVVWPGYLPLYYNRGSYFGFPDQKVWINRLYNGYNWYANGLHELDPTKPPQARFDHTVRGTTIPKVTRIHKNTLVYNALGLDIEIFIVPIKHPKEEFVLLGEKDDKKNNYNNNNHLYKKAASMEIQLLTSETETLTHMNDEVNQDVECIVEAIPDEDNPGFLLETPFRSFQMDWIFKKTIKENWHHTFIDTAQKYIQNNQKTCDPNKLLTCKSISNTDQDLHTFPVSGSNNLKGKCVCVNNGGAQIPDANGNLVCCRHFTIYQEEIRFFNLSKPLYPVPHGDTFLKAFNKPDEYYHCSSEDNPYCSEVSDSTLSFFQKVLHGSIELKYDIKEIDQGYKEIPPDTVTFRLNAFFMGTLLLEKREEEKQKCSKYNFYQTIKNLYRKHEKMELESPHDYATNKFIADESWMYTKKFNELCRLDFQNDLFHSYDIDSTCTPASNSFDNRVALLQDLSSRTKKTFALCKLNENMICTEVKKSKSTVFGQCKCMEGFHDIPYKGKRICVPGNGQQCFQDTTSITAIKYFETYEGPQKLLRKLPTPPENCLNSNGGGVCVIIPPHFKPKISQSDLECHVGEKSDAKLHCSAGKCKCNDPTFYQISCTKKASPLISLIIEHMEKVNPGSTKKLDYSPFGESDVATIAEQFYPQYDPCTADVQTDDLYNRLNDLIKPETGSEDDIKKANNEKIRKISESIKELDQSLKYCIPSILPLHVPPKKQNFKRTYTCKGHCHQRDYSGLQIDKNITNLNILASHQTVGATCNKVVADLFHTKILAQYYLLRESTELKNYFDKGLASYADLIETFLPATDLNSIFVNNEELRQTYLQFIVDLNDYGYKFMKENFTYNLCQQGLECKEGRCLCKKGTFLPKRGDQTKCVVDYWHICSQCPKTPYYLCDEDEEDKVEAAKACKIGSTCVEINLNDPRVQTLKIDERYTTKVCAPDNPEDYDNLP